MGLGQSQVQRIHLVQRLEMPFEISGDLELLSLHRIKNRINNLDVHPEVRQKLIVNLVRENQEYKQTSGNNWSCITPTSLDNAVYSTIAYLRKKLDLYDLKNQKVKIDFLCNDIEICLRYYQLTNKDNKTWFIFEKI